MAPSQKSNAQGDGKQKSLMAWLKKPQTGPNNAAQSTSGAAKVQPVKQGKAIELRTPESKKYDRAHIHSSGVKSSRSSDGGSSVKDTPPTSDPVDVDMLSAEESSESERVQAKSVSIFAEIDRIDA